MYHKITKNAVKNSYEKIKKHYEEKWINQRENSSRGWRCERKQREIEQDIILRTLAEGKKTNKTEHFNKYHKELKSIEGVRKNFEKQTPKRCCFLIFGKFKSSMHCVFPGQGKSWFSTISYFYQYSLYYLFRHRFV